MGQKRRQHRSSLTKVRLMDYHLIGEEYQSFNDTRQCVCDRKKLPNEKELKAVHII